MGRFDARTLYFQTISERPVVGGFVARLPERVRSWYRHAPVISTVLRLSDPACPPDWHPGAATPDEVYRALSAASVAFVVLDRTTAPARLLQYVASWPLRPLASDEGRTLYAVRQP